MKNEQLIIAAILEATPYSIPVTVSRRALTRGDAPRHAYLIESADGYTFTVLDTGFSLFRTVANPATGKTHKQFARWVPFPFDAPKKDAYSEVKEAVFNVLADAIQQG